MLKIAIILVAFALLFTGCSTNPAQDNVEVPDDNVTTSNSRDNGGGVSLPENQKKVTLITGGCGYEVGDIVLLDTKKRTRAW